MHYNSRFVCWVTYRHVGLDAYHLLSCYMYVYLKIVNTQVTIILTYLYIDRTELLALYVMSLQLLPLPIKFNIQSKPFWAHNF